jgi:5-methylcytosine-specific restriction endonuclease McrA
MRAAIYDATQRLQRMVRTRTVDELNAAQRSIRTILSARVPRRASANPRRVSPSMRAFVLERDNFRCRRCNAAAVDGARLEVDHIKPVSQGGKGDHDNLQTLCWNCNSGKRDREPHAHDLRPR